MKLNFLSFTNFDAHEGGRYGIETSSDISFPEKIVPELGDQKGRRAGGLKVPDVFQNFHFLVVILIEKIDLSSWCIFKFCIIDPELYTSPHVLSKSDTHEVGDHHEVVLLTGSDHGSIVPNESVLFLFFF